LKEITCPYTQSSISKYHQLTSTSQKKRIMLKGLACVTNLELDELEKNG